MEVETDLVRPSPYQPRLVFDLNDLRSEIEKDGLLSDLVVRKKEEFFELVDGERRWRILKELGWKTVPVQVIDADDAKAMLSTYKLNKVRENYTVEEEARYFQKLVEEGMTLSEISRNLNVDSRWVQAHLNTFRFPEDIQKAIWSKQISLSHIIALESVIDRNIKEAVLTANEILQRRLTRSETEKIVKKRDRELKARVEDMRIKAAQKVLPAVALRAPKLETAKDFEEAAKALKQKAKEMREGTLATEEINTLAKASEMKEAEEEEVSVEALRRLRKKIGTLEKEKESLLEEKGFLTEALSFNCPHCDHSCIVYREGDSYWVE